MARFRNHNQAWLETIEGQQVTYEDDDPSAMNNPGPYGFDSMAFGNQDDYLNQFGYDDAGNLDRFDHSLKMIYDVSRWISIRWSRFSRYESLEFIE